MYGTVWKIWWICVDLAGSCVLPLYILLWGYLDPGLFENSWSMTKSILPLSHIAWVEHCGLLRLSLNPKRMTDSPLFPFRWDAPQRRHRNGISVLLSMVCRHHRNRLSLLLSMVCRMPGCSSSLCTILLIDSSSPLGSIRDDAIYRIGKPFLPSSVLLIRLVLRE